MFRNIFLKRKKLSLCHKLWFSNPYIFGTQCLRPYLFQTKYAVRSNNLSLKCQRFTSSGSEDIGISKLSLWQKLLSFVNKSMIESIISFSSLYWIYYFYKFFKCRLFNYTSRKSEENLMNLSTTLHIQFN